MGRAPACIGQSPGLAGCRLNEARIRWLTRIRSPSERDSSASHRSPRGTTKEVIREQSGPSQCLQSYRVAGCPASSAAPVALSSAHSPYLVADSIHGYLRGSCAVTTPERPPSPASVRVAVTFRARAPGLGAVLSGCSPPKRRSRR